MKVQKYSLKVAGPIIIVASILAAPCLWHPKTGMTTTVPESIPTAMAKAYLNSCANAILFTIGDDTFPLWYAQEIEHVRTDIKIVNTSLL
jgi:hypothetical protein